MDIKINHNELGSIVISPNNVIEKKKKNMIKGLAFLQLICMTPINEEDEHFEEFIDIISKATIEIRTLYNGTETDTNSSIEQF